jgi:hypothetical protein
VEAAYAPGSWPDQHGNSTVYSSTIVHCVQSLYINAMYTVINQCCPNRCLATCSSTVVTPTQLVPLVLFTVPFFFHTFGLTQRQSLALSFAHVMCSSPICSVHFKVYNILFLFKIFHIAFTSKPAIKTKTKILLVTDRVRAALHFFIVSSP